MISLQCYEDARIVVAVHYMPLVGAVSDHEGHHEDTKHEASEGLALFLVVMDFEVEPLTE